MDNFNKFQILKLSFITALLVAAPLLSTSLRSTYIYFVFNLLIILLGAEAGLLSFFAKAEEVKKPVTTALTPKVVQEIISSDHKKEGLAYEHTTTINNPILSPKPVQKNVVAKVVEKCSSEKIVGRAVRVNKVKKCPSTPSLFFIGGGETEAEEVVIEGGGGEEEIGIPTGQELFYKAETFIGNFYKQLKMQREDSWKKIHGFYQKAF